MTPIYTSTDIDSSHKQHQRLALLHQLSELFSFALRVELSYIPDATNKPEQHHSISRNTRTCWAFKAPFRAPRVPCAFNRIIPGTHQNGTLDLANTQNGNTRSCEHHDFQATPLVWPYLGPSLFSQNKQHNTTSRTLDERERDSSRPYSSTHTLRICPYI